MQFGHLIRNFQLFSLNHAHILLSSLQLNTDNWVTATLGDRLSTKKRQPPRIHIPVYNTCTLLLNKEKYVDSNLDASDDAISDNESSTMSKTGMSQKQVMPQTEFPTIFSKSCTYITYIFIMHACIFILFQVCS